MLKTLYNKDKTRLQLVKSIPGNNNNYLFLPGGPGVDSSSLMGLVNELNIPGNYWLVDLILNGTNDEHFSEQEEIYLKWPEFLINAIKDFENPILIGHSFGGYLPLFIPELDELLKGFIMIGSTPNLKSNLFQSVAEKHNLPSLTEEKAKFIENPNLQNLKALYEKEAFYFFSKNYQKQGLEDIVKKLIYCLKTEHWWYSGGYKAFSEITWIPQNTPTLILGGSDDHITPFQIFREDKRFGRPNIKLCEIENCGHFPWLEQPKEIEHTIEQFIKNLL